jgi:lipoate-protein ligase A
MLWRNAPAVIIGKYQNAFSEVDLGYARELGIEVVRRISGGGAVYHDLGNINYSLILNRPPGQPLDIHRYSLPILQTLQRLGVAAELNGRNDLLAAGRKISGNAQFADSTGLLHHGTLLYDVDLTRMQRVLAVRADKIAAKGVSSVKAHVANISEFLRPAMDTEAFMERLRDCMTEYCRVSGEYRLGADDEVALRELREQRYGTWQWNIGRSPEAGLTYSRRLAAGSLELFLELNRGMIERLSVYGDFFAAPGWEDLLAGLSGLRYDRDVIAAYLDGFDIPALCLGLRPEDLLSCIMRD